MGIELGPDPSRTYLQRHNEMYPHRYGKLGQERESSSTRSKPREADSALKYTGTAGEGNSNGTDMVDGIRLIIVLVASLLVTWFATFQLYRFTHPEPMTANWFYFYVAAFLGFGLLSVVGLWKVRRVLTWLVVLGTVTGAFALFASILRSIADIAGWA